MLFVQLRGGTVGIPPMTSDLTERVAPPPAEAGAEPDQWVVRRVARALAVAEVTESGMTFEVAALANADHYVLGGARIAQSLRMTLEELPRVHSAGDVLLHIERQHPKARGKLEACVSRVRFEHCSVWRLDYALDYDPGNTYDVVLPTRSSVGAFSLEPTWYMTIAWELLSLP